MRLIKFVPAVALACCAMGAQASLVGDSVSVTNIFGGTIFQGPSIVVVGAGTELVNFGEAWDIDIGATTIRLTCSGGSGCDGSANVAIDSYLFEDLDPGLLGVSIDGSSTAANAIANISGLTFGSDSLRIDFANAITGVQGQFVLLNLQLAGAVPEPGNIALVGLALAGLGASRRRQRVTPAA